MKYRSFHAQVTFLQVSTRNHFLKFTNLYIPRKNNTENTKQKQWFGNFVKMRTSTKYKYKGGMFVLPKKKIQIRKTND